MTLGSVEHAELDEQKISPVCVSVYPSLLAGAGNDVSRAETKERPAYVEAVYRNLIVKIQNKIKNCCFTLTEPDTSKCPHTKSAIKLSYINIFSFFFHRAFKQL